MNVKKIIFLIQTNIIWVSYESLYFEFIKYKNIDIKIILLPFLEIKEDLEKIATLLNQKKIPWLLWNEYSIEDKKPDVVFYQMPYAWTYPSGYHLDFVKNIAQKIYYIPYASEVGASSTLIPSYFQQEVHIKASNIFVISERAKLLFSKYCPVGNQHTIVAGAPKFDIILKEYHSCIISDEWKNKISNRTVILWNASLGVGITDLSTFFDWINFILQFFSTYSDLYTLVFRPHPLMFNHMIRDQIATNAQINNFKQSLEQYSNIILDENCSYIPAFSVSHALISDMSSMLITYMITDKPILYLENPKNNGFLEDIISHEEVENSLYSAKNEQELISFFSMVKDKVDPKLICRQQLKEQLIYKPDGHCAERIVDYVIKNLE